MKDPLNKGMERRAKEETTTVAPKQQEVPLNADNAARIIGDFLGQQKENIQFHNTMGQCLAYLHKNSRAQEDYIAATNQP